MAGMRLWKCGGLALLAGLGLALTAPGVADGPTGAGLIVYAQARCVVIRTAGGFTLARAVAGPAEEGHEVRGNLGGIGPRTLWDRIGERQLGVWLEEFWVGDARAAAWIVERGCHR